MGFEDFALDVTGMAATNAVGWLADFSGLIGMVFSIAVLGLLLRVVFGFLPR